ncbi:hypothetical protein GCM10027590_30490 [Nocardiopsis nanhaiensis]
MAKEEEKGPHQLKHCENGAAVTYPQGHTNPDCVREGAPTVHPPEAPPCLTPEAAQALLRIIRKAYARRIADDIDPLSDDRRT